MKFLIFYKSITQVGGAENFLMDFSKSLLKKHEISIICFEYNSLNFKNHQELLPYLKVIKTNSIRRIYDLGMESKKYDYSLIHSGFKDFYLSKLLFKSKYILFLHHPFFHTLDYFDVLSVFHNSNRKKLQLDPVFKHFEKQLRIKARSSNFFKINTLALLNILSIKNACRTIVLSKYSKIEKYSYFKINSSYLPPAISNNFLSQINSSSPIQKEKHILYFGRLTKEKRVDLLINSFEKSNLKDYVLYIIGVGEDEDRLKKLAAKCKKGIIFLGYQSNSNLIEHIKRAKFTVTLEWVDYNLTVYESIALGTRVIYGKYFDEEPFDLPLIRSKMLLHVKPNVDSVSNLMNEVSKLPDVNFEDYSFMRNYNWDWYVDNFLMLFGDE